MKRLDAIVRGRVQGVFFRQHTVEQARALGLTGWVANRANGTVQVVAEGDEAKLRRLLEWLHVGSPMSYVDGVDVYWDEASGDFTGFTVRG